ncbi:MAG: PCRF domain-containing protein, partial [Coxiellaceae bacterium]|nr:PCRF domain-containing protein [Coxiellaceae bacterium]
MKESLIIKLKKLVYRYQELGGMLSDPVIINDQNRFRGLSKEYAALEPIVKCYQTYETNMADLQAAEEMLSDPELKAMAQDEIETLKTQKVELEENLKILLLPKDPNDDKNVFLEIRAGTGGHEAALFSGDLFRMYSRFAESKKWQVEVISESEGEQGGYKEIIARIVGSNVYSQLKFESG